MAPAVSKSSEEAGEQITRDGYSWANSLGAAVGPISFGFRATAPNYDDDSPQYGNHPNYNTFSEFTKVQIDAADLAIQLWESVAAIDLTRVGTGDTGQAAYADNATILFANYYSATDGSGAYAWSPSPTGTSTDSSPGSRPGDVWDNIEDNDVDPSSSNIHFLPGNYNFLTILHELGHALGLEHPGDYNAAPGVPLTYDNNAAYVEDTRQHTVMSYFGAWNASDGAFDTGDASTDSILPSTPMIDDIVALQRLYGANLNSESGNTTYGFNSNADLSVFHINSPTQQVAFTIWDAVGNDTLDLSGYSGSQTIDLRPGQYSSTLGLTDNIAVAAAVTVSGAVVDYIENALGGSGNDNITGNDAANILVGNLGFDTIHGGEGGDTIKGGDQGDQLFGDGGNDIIFGGMGADTIDGGSGDDILNGGVGNDVISGGSGRDFLTGGSGIDSLDGGSGNSDVADYRQEGGPGAVTVTFSAQGAATATDTFGYTDTLTSIEEIYGTSLGDTFTGSSGSETFLPGRGDDVISSGGGLDSISYLADDGATSGVTMNFLTGIVTSAYYGTDSISGYFRYAYGTQLDDTIVGGTNSYQRFLPSLGTDTITGHSGFDVLRYTDYRTTDSGFGVSYHVGSVYGSGTVIDAGGSTDTYSGIDYLAGSHNNDTFIGGGAQATCQGLEGNNVYNGGSHGLDVVDYSFDDTFGAAHGVQVNLMLGTGVNAFGGSDTYSQISRVYGTTFADTLQGGTEDDQFWGLEGNDIINGGAGNDAADYSQDAAYGGLNGVTVDLQNGTAIDGFGSIDTLSGIEYVTGTKFADSITGDGNANILRGLNGADVLNGGGSSDYVDYDWDQSFGGNSGIVVNLEAGQATDGFGATDTLVQIENALGTASSDVIVGDANANFLEGRAGDDTLNGGAGFDTIYGDDGMDTISGGDQGDTIYGGAGDDIIGGGMGADTIDGGSGNDTITGGQGYDNLTGGAGADTFVFTAPAGFGVDAIMDFVRGSDLIQISASGFGGGLQSNVSASLVDIADHASVSTGGAHFIFQTSDQSLWWDQNGGDGSDSVEFATLSGVASLSSADIHVV